MILDYFDDQKVEATWRTFITAPSEGGQWTETTAADTIIKGVKYSASRAAQYFQNHIDENVDEVFLTDEATPNLKDSIIYEGQEYKVETVENIGEQDEAVMIGLRLHI